ncbi:alpha-ribazole phosphatase family protein [Ideonella sp. 4Y16]|uniref:Alpha-ribazole phosphatase family protein n=1 Tax=Ideonella alba TaxID=2824118 RepID=A0A940YCC5_9BURK|nr:alpha-ribazole phosphatase family protein [Ideonella alba]MBQ0932983.1 alpha-ribazole phosphatase family protein [Ideonella alba]MBQ0945771.1 alpha-ribazole phosphatase family protein [Ideonella alba]
MELILLRHPVVAAPAGICYGQADLPAREPLEPPPAQVLQALPGPVDALWTSPLRRARVLAEALAATLGCPPREDARWMELHFGAWEGHPWSAIDRAESDPWADDPEHRAPPGGETLAALRARVHAAMDALAATRLQRVLVVAHAGPIRVALARARGQAATEALAQPLAFGGLTVLRHDGQGWSQAA